MDNIITWIKLVAGVITGLLSYLFGGLDMLFTALLVCIAVDYICLLYTSSLSFILDWLFQDGLYQYSVPGDGGTKTSFVIVNGNDTQGGGCRQTFIELSLIHIFPCVRRKRHPCVCLLF